MQSKFFSILTQNSVRLFVVNKNSTFEFPILNLSQESAYHYTSTFHLNVYFIEDYQTIQVEDKGLLLFEVMHIHTLTMWEV